MTGAEVQQIVRLAEQGKTVTQIRRLVGRIRMVLGQAQGSLSSSFSPLTVGSFDVAVRSRLS